MITFIEFKIYLFRILDVIYKIYNDSFKLFGYTTKTGDTCNILLNAMVILSLYGFIIYLVVYNFILTNYYLYYKTTNIFRENPTLSIIPEYNQVTNIYYITDWFSIDWNIFLYIFYILHIFVFIGYLFYYSSIPNILVEFQYTIALFVIILFIIIIYIFTNFYNTNKLSIKIKNIMNILYNNINNEYLNTYICNYNDDNNGLNIDFEKGKCNDIKKHFSNNGLYNYLSSVINEIETLKNKSIKDMDIDIIKKIEDKNGKKYYDKLISAFITYELVKYFINNNLIEESKEFFSVLNTSNSNILNLINSKLNIFLYLKLNNLSLLEANYTYNDKMKETIKNPKLFYSILKEYLVIETSLTNSVNDVYNICKNDITCVYIYYLLISVITIIFIIVYFISNI